MSETKYASTLSILCRINMNIRYKNFETIYNFFCSNDKTTKQFYQEIIIDKFIERECLLISINNNVYVIEVH